MAFFIEFDENNVLKARYDSAVHRVIPATAVEVDEATFRKTMREADALWRRNPKTGRITKGERPVPRALHAEVWDAVKAERAARREAGYRVEHEGQTFWFNSDEASRLQLLLLYAMGDLLPAGMPWTTLANDSVEMTPALAEAMATALLAHDNALHAAAQAHRAAIDTLDDPTGYAQSAGWPESYREWLSAVAATDEELTVSEALPARVSRRRTAAKAATAPAPARGRAKAAAPTAGVDKPKATRAAKSGHAPAGAAVSTKAQRRKTGAQGKVS